MCLSDDCGEAGGGRCSFLGGARQALIFSTEFARVGAVVNFYGPPALNPAAYRSRKGPFKPDVMDVSAPRRRSSRTRA